jgi:predicted transporter
LVVGLLYLGAGSILIFAGVTVLRDWRKGKK